MQAGEVDEAVATHQRRPHKSTYEDDQAVTNFTKSKKKAWTSSEKAAVKRNLGKFMTVSSKLPGKSEIDKCLHNEPCLKHRSWLNVKDFVRNFKTSNARAMKYHE